MNYDSLHDYLKDKLIGEKERATFNLIGGKATQNEYHRLCGVIQGLDYAVALLDDLAKRMEDDDE